MRFALGPVMQGQFHDLGDLLFAAVSVARKLKVDPELALRSASERFRGRVEAAGKLVGSEMNEPTQRRLVEQFLAENRN